MIGSKKLMCVSLVVVLFSSLTNAQVKPNVPQLGKSPLKDVIIAMTLDEKLHLVVGTAQSRPTPPPSPNGLPTQATITEANNNANTYVSREKVPGAAGQGYAIPRLGIPALVYSDGPAGLRIDTARENDLKKYFATAFPVATLLASTWDTALVRKVGTAIGNEVREYGVDVLLAPGMNIHRNPLTGRNFEYYSEDPLIAGWMAASMVNGVESNGVGTSIKHFAVNNQEINRNGINAILSERALREIYLKGFQIAVKNAQPWTVMSSYNQINGQYASQSYDLLTTILRKEWGFKGFVMTDWWAGYDPVAQMKAGNDLIMPGHPDQIETLRQAINNGTLSIDVVNQNVERILNVILQSPAFKNYKYSNTPDLKQHALITHTSAAEGMVLLKNNNTLPITKAPKKVALFGYSSYDILAGGQGSGYVNKAYKVSLDEGMKAKEYSINSELATLYNNYIVTEKAKYPKENFWKAPVIDEMKMDKDVIDRMSNDADVAIISIKRNSGEGDDRKLQGDFYLTQVEKDLINNVASSFHEKNKKVIVVLNIGGVIETASWRDVPDAILLAWQPGQEGGHAIADILTGKVNPSGKLATTFPMDYNDIASSKNFPGTPANDPKEVRYEEGIYVGYRYFNTFNVKPAYEFGYGLSYTNFTYGPLVLNSKTMSGKITATIKIINSGKVAGREIVQLYISAPGKTMEKPAMELKAFAKTKLMQPGSSETLTFTLTPSDLASFDAGRSAWVAEEGMYDVQAASSSLNIKQSSKFLLGKEVVVEKVNKALPLQSELNELRAHLF